MFIYIVNDSENDSRYPIMLFITCFVLFNSFNTIFTNDLFEERETLIKREMDMMLGHDIELSDSELDANKIIMNLKEQELNYGFTHPHYFNLSKHFFEYKEQVKQTKLYEIIKKMPKGAVLHAHDTAILGPDYILNITYVPHLYVCLENRVPRYKFAADTPATKCDMPWQLLADLRKTNKINDTELRSHFSLVVDNPREQYTDINAVWTKFADYFASTWDLYGYKPVWEQYFYDALKALREDNVMYLEIRSVLPPLYDLDGDILDSIAAAKSYKTVLDRFLKDYPDFMGAKLIYAPMRSVAPKTVKDYLKEAYKIKKCLPDLLAGFDLVGQEDLGRPYKDFLPQLEEAAQDFDFFFHAGETNWYGTSSDENLVDAIVLNTRRIGHGYALIKHPVLIEEIKKRGIAIESNVISNAVLKLVDDVRNHPLASYLAQDLPVVISSDDPGVWEAEPLTHDFYVTFLGVASRHADIRLLKKLALNSLIYSTHRNKIELVNEFEKRWIKFVEYVVKDTGISHDSDVKKEYVKYSGPTVKESL